MFLLIWHLNSEKCKQTRSQACETHWGLGHHRFWWGLRGVSEAAVSPVPPAAAETEPAAWRTHGWPVEGKKQKLNKQLNKAQVLALKCLNRKEFTVTQRSSNQISINTQPPGSLRSKINRILRVGGEVGGAYALSLSITATLTNRECLKFRYVEEDRHCYPPNQLRVTERNYSLGEDSLTVFTFFPLRSTFLPSS